MLGSEVGITAGHLDGLVAHQLLRGTQVNSSHDETTGEGVSQTMPGDSGNTCHFDCRLKPLSWFRQLPSVTIEKYILASITLCVSLQVRLRPRHRIAGCQTGCFHSSAIRPGEAERLGRGEHEKRLEENFCDSEIENRTTVKGENVKHSKKSLHRLYVFAAIVFGPSSNIAKHTPS